MASEPSDSLVALLVAKKRLLERVFNSIPREWPNHIERFRSDVLSVTGAIPPAALIFVFAEVASVIGQLVDQSVPVSSNLLPATTDSLAPHELLDRFTANARRWLVACPAESLVMAVNVRRMAAYIEDHFADRITRETIAKLSGVAPKEAGRLFRAIMGISISCYVRGVRLNEAAARLRNGEKVESVIVAVGWKGRSCFSHFRRRFGLSPAEYRDNWSFLRAK